MIKRKNDGRQYIFVGGMPRSGTTLVQNMLGSHSEICGMPEFLVLIHILQTYKRMNQYHEIGKIDSICGKDQIKKNTVKYIDGFLENFRKSHKKKLLSEKSPDNVLVFSQLKELYPKAKFIFVVRDPRAIISSLFEVRKRAEARGIRPPHISMGCRIAIGRTKNYFQKGFDFADDNPEQALIVRYEDCVNDSESETKRICAFLDIKWEAGMQSPRHETLLNRKSMVKNNFKQIYYSEKLFDRKPDKSRVNRWTQKLSITDQSRITDAFKDDINLARLGYQIDLRHLPENKRLIGRGLSSVKTKLGSMRLKLAGVHE